ncbi:condensin subunit Smc [Malonomonas rubra DSM 5091]|uniref:Chromosome partition protein Smc n=1 Tax=Malonomonas rubra DSM 5091 TaxID=1122189 RepID=A0A1M6MWX7_MALRU|nr:chromosome segregation protein SMC [Malonomonas rubra]SHJ87998.1 condensin subunit Smc [Malonomonas rubra DSM 5091]
MKIKRLDIIGFKSFVDKVSLDFQHGITGVVGPNGCGKSNIVDAIRWVMGEQNARHLRGRAMEDIIFGGSESRKPHGMAQVSIVFDNSAKICPPAYKDYAEIMVTRRLYRNGDSEYLINKTACRLLDITELFMDTGVGARAYSIIEQGKVGMLISAKPEERRSLIEEAAGVTKFKARKKTALRKMDATKQNMVRLGDIISEVRRQLGSLKRQAQRAEQFREYRGEAKRIELCLTGNRFQELQREVDIVSKQQKEQAEILARLDARLEDGELQLEEKQLQVAVIESDLNKAQEQVFHLAAEVQRVENEMTLGKRQREHLLEQDQELQAELQALSQRQQMVAAELEQLTEEKSGYGDRLETVEQDVEQQEEALRQSLSREQQLESQLEDSRRTLMELLAEASRLANRHDEIERRLNSEQERQQQLRADSIRLQEQQQEMQEQQAQLVRKKEQVAEQQAELAEHGRYLQQQRHEKEQQRKELDDRLGELRRHLEKNRSRRESLQELERSLDGYSEGVRALLSESQRWQQVAADLFKVAPEYELPLEIALGEKLQAVPVVDEQQRDDAIQILLDKQQRATLLLPTQTAAQVDFGDGIALSDLVEVTAEKQLVERLLAGIYLVDSVRDFTATDLPAGLLLVDRDGGSLSWRGELIAGAKVADSAGLLRKKRQIEELGVKISQQEEELTRQQREIDQLQDELLQLEEEQTFNSGEDHRLELQALELEKDRQGLNAELARLTERLELVAFELDQVRESETALQEEKQQLSVGSQQSGERQQQLEEQVSGFQRLLQELRQTLDVAREELTERRVALAAMQQQRRGLDDTLQRLQNQQQEMEQRTGQLLQRQQSGGSQQQELLKTDERLRVELDLLLDKREEQQQASQRIRDNYEQQRQQLDEFRDQLRGVRSEAEELRKEVARLQLRQHELHVDAEAVRQGVLERYRVDLYEHQVPEATEDELERQQHQLQRLQRRIEALGEVNLMAIDEYKEQEERYDFLCGQRDDLNQSLADLQKAINQINRTTRRRFKETFDLVNEKFKQVFPRLFRGGQAELRLTDEDDLLETGIDIIVQPPGKRLQNVNLLSGGEKALTAVALIFSLFLIKPTPFCVLDEVDAPLDDANIDRFAEMVREMTEQSQFIIITHSKRTMSIVDTMYGVTMQEPGVSKLVSVRINERTENDSDMAQSA